MGFGKDYDKQMIIDQIKIGHYIRWKPVLKEPILSEYSEVGFKSFVGTGNDWQYGLVLDMMQSPRDIDSPDNVQGLHLRLLKGAETDWIFNFEYFREIEIIGFLDED